MRTLYRLSKLALAIVLVAVGGWLWFGFTLPSDPENDPAQVDAIVVFTGGGDRLREGARLLQSSRGEVMFVSGVNRLVDRNELLRRAGELTPEQRERIFIGYVAGDTVGNAEEVAQWARLRNVKSVRLVTANYHMRRSVMELRGKAPGLKIIPHPVFPENVTANTWWRNGTGLKIVAKEYLKYLAAFARVTVRA
ncbi:MAG: YdcF family protein [Alphaproteobacteria bacterium]